MTRKLRKGAHIDAPVDAVWQAWTTSEGCERFFGRRARVDLRLHGPYEQLFLLDRPEGQQGSEGCRILSFLPGEMLSFEWNAPPQFDELRQEKTFVIVQLEPDDDGTHVTLTHLGWGEGGRWDELYDYSDAAWGRVLDSLQQAMAGA